MFRNPGLARVNVALAGSVIGDWAYGVAVSVYAYLEGGATAVGVLGVVRYVSSAIVAPFASTLADRYDRKRIMVRADLVRFALVSGVTALALVDGPALVVYALAVLTTVVATAFRPAQASLIPKLARHPDELTAANVASSTIESLGFFAGPALAGVLLAVTGLEVVFGFNALTFLWSAAVLGRLVVPDLREGTGAGAGEEEVDVVLDLVAEAAPAVSPAAVGALVGAPADVAEPVPGPPVPAAAGPADGPPGPGPEPDGPGLLVEVEPESEPERASFLSDTSQGFRTILGSPELRIMVGVYAAQTVVAGASLVFTVAVALDLLGLSESAVGMLDATIGIGGLAGGFAVLMLAQGGGLARNFGLGVVAWAAPLLLMAAVPELWASVVAMITIGLANAVVDVSAFTVVQRLAPDEVMGRVFGAMESTLIASMALGSLAMPLLISTVGLRAGLVVIGAGVTTVALLALPRLRQVDRVALAPEGLELLRSLSMLAPLSQRVLERLARSSEVHRYPAGSTICAEGDDGERFFVIEEGEVVVSVGGEEIGRMPAGAAFGEIALLRDCPRTATVRALTDVVCRTLSKDDFVPAVTGHGDAAREADLVVNGWIGST
ncbi:MAG TPA: MFS transporter [Acidimicrobiales bacterium]|nr:MFS transporter [Acidimicrobiales bacterium]